MRRLASRHEKPKPPDEKPGHLARETSVGRSVHSCRVLNLGHVHKITVITVMTVRFMYPRDVGAGTRCCVMITSSLHFFKFILQKKVITH